MESYEFLAGSYDTLTWDVDYVRWANYLEKLLRLKEDHWDNEKKEWGPPGTILDLCCGTGSLTLELARRGYKMIGVDRSPEMLAIAEQKCREAGLAVPFYCQDITSLRLPEKVDMCICTLDSVNYVLQPKKLQKAFRRIWENMKRGSTFVFDVDTPEKLRVMDGQVFLDETEDVFCVWRGEYSEKKRICTFWMDIFQKEGGLWRRGEEIHQEYAYTMQELRQYLKEAGFMYVTRHGELKMGKPKEGEQRIFFRASKPIIPRGRYQ